MILKVNKKTGEERIIATTSTSNIEVDDPRIVLEKKPLSDVLFDYSNKITKLSSYVKWLYKYGGTGSGGGSGGGGVPNAYIEVLNNNLVTSGNTNVIYESANSLALKYRIFQQGGTYTYTHTIIVNNQKIVDNQPLRSNVEASIVLSNLSTTEPNIIRISSYDDQGFSLQDYTLRVVSGSIVIGSPTVNNNGSISRYYGTGDIQIEFNINNRVLGSTTILEIKLNNREDGKVTETFNNDGALSYRLRIMEQLNQGNMLETGTTYTITARAYSTLGDNTIPSSIYTFAVALIDNQSLIITLNGISETTVEDDDLNIATFLQGSDITFFYGLNAASYSTFRVAFEILDDHENIIDAIGSKYPPGVVYDEDGKDLWESNKIVTKGVSNTFSYSSAKIPTDKIGILYIKIYAWTIDSTIGSGVGSIDDNQNPLPIKVGKGLLKPVSQSIPAYTILNNTRYLNMDVPIDFSELQDKDHFRFSANVYDDQNQPIVTHTSLDLFNCNHISSGFIQNSLSMGYSALRLAGGAYGTLNLDYFNGANIGSWSIINAGWTFSFTFKADQHPDANGTIFSYGTYDADNELISGIEITLEEAKMVFFDDRSTKTIKTVLVQDVLTTIDFICRKNPADNSGFMEIYLDGALAAVELIESPDKLSLGILRDGAYIGGRKTSNQMDDFCDVNIYNIRIYKNALMMPDIINNYIINYAYLSRYPDGAFNWTEIESLRRKNFVESDWTNMLWDYLDNSWLTGTELYNRINSAPALPIIYLSETSSSPEFHNRYNTSYNEANADNARNYLAPVSMIYRDIQGNVRPVSDMSVSLQGTSSLGYSSKNLEIYFGEDNDGLPRLFTPKDDWLPENQFTMKADVMDSAHANNTAIGGFINDYFEDNHPMKFPGNPYRNKVKHTLEGFPCYMFMKFGDNVEPTFLGIYNFNLGRGSNYNMGFEVLGNYELEYENAPSLVKSYTKVDEPYSGGVFSFEFNTNSPTDLVAFQQPDRSIIDHIIDQRYPARGHASEQQGWNRLYETFNVFSRFYRTADAPKKWIYTNGQFVETEDTVGTQLTPNMEIFPLLTDDPEGFVFWNNACRYFCAAMAFGMVDSLGKNLTLRSWNVNDSRQSGLWNMSFYDMDTALGIDNYGKQDIPATCYIDYWYNEEEEGYTTAKRMINGAPSGIKTYDMPSSRMWEILRLMGEQYDPGNVSMNYQSYWSELRKNGGMLESANKFMDNYYLKHVKDVGSIIYNLDYNTKYLKKYEFENDDGTTTVGYNDLKFLHGTRKNYVHKWLEKRLRYIDSCMNIAGLYSLNENTQWVSDYQTESFSDSPYVNQWRGRGNGSDNDMFEFNIISNTPILFFMTIATNSQRILLADNDRSVIKFKGTRASSSTMSWNNTNNISIFEGFDQLNFNAIGMFTMRNLLELNFSNIQSFDTTSISEFNISQLSEIRELNLESTKAVNPDSGFIIDVSRCLKLKKLNIRNSDAGSLILPGGSGGDEISAGVIEEILLTGSLLSNFTITNQRFIKRLDFTDCRRLMNVEISTLYELEEIIFNNNSQIQGINISNCPNLKSIVCQNSNQLVDFIVDNCESVEDIDISRCNNNQLRINLNGAFNLKSLNLEYLGTSINPILPSWEAQLSNLNFYDTLETLNISNSAIKAFDFGTIDNNSKYEGESILDLSHFTNLQSWNNSTKTGLLAINNGSVRYIKFNNNSEDPFILSNITNPAGGSVGMFTGCQGLLRIFGHVALNGNNTFSNCNSFYIHDEDIVGGITKMPIKNEFFGPDTKSTNERTIWNNNQQLNTNITVTTTNLSNAFGNTAINLYNVYYILNQCDNVTNLSSTFSYCDFIQTRTIGNSLNRDMFKYCGKVTNISSIFYRTTGIKGILYSAEYAGGGHTGTKLKNGLLTPLVSLTGGGFNSAFYGTNIEYMDDNFFGLDNNNNSMKLTSLSSVFYNAPYRYVENSNAVTMVETAAKASNIFRYLPQLSSLSYFMTNGQSVNFDTKTENIAGVDVTYCPLFFYTPNMTTITNSLTSIGATGSWVNLFGGQQELRNRYPNNFPRNFANMRNSFIISRVHGSNRLEFPIRNDMFSRIKHSIVSITGATLNVATSTSSLSGTINKTYNPEDNGYDTFPWRIFEGCTNLQDISCFFKDLIYEVDSPIELPGDRLFRDTTNLRNISYLFYNMVGVQYSLTSKGFINCQLQNVHSAFANPSNTNGTSANIQGSIPYGLFYMETSLRKTVQGWKSGAGIDENYGFDAEHNFIPDLPLPEVNNNLISYRDIRRTITNMTNVLRYYSSTTAQPYQLQLGEMTTLANAGDILRYNEKYNDVKYILNPNYNADTVSPEIPNPVYDPGDPSSSENIPNPLYDNRRVIINPEYDTRFRVWNEWCVDGTNIKDTVESSILYQTSNEAYGTELPESYYDINNTYNNTNISGKLATMNYVCPPDLFLYCNNSSNTVVSYALANSNRRGTAGDGNYGLFGRIPPKIFEPITQVPTLEGVFYYLHYLAPYSWNHVDENGDNQYGRIYHPELLRKNGANLRSVANLFGGTEMASNCIVDSRFLYYNTTLNNISGLWGSSCTWWSNSSNVLQLPINIFSNNKNLQNISNLIGNAGDYANGPAYIDASWFTAANHKSISNISGFSRRCINSRGTLPEFWKWTNITAGNRTEAFDYMSMSNITNLSEAAASKYSSSVTNIQP